MVLCAGAFGCYAAQGSLPGAQGQGYDLNLSYSRTTLKAVADAITQQVGIAFSYETALAGYPMENLEVSEKGATIEAILAAVFTPRGIDYRVVDKVVVLTRSTRPVPAASAAAKSEVKGVVRDAAGNPMIGVTVTIKGTLVGVSTGVDGGYAIPADGNATLLFSYIGYRPHEEVVGRRTQIDVTMQEDELVMDEVVVVGYGTLKKRNIVGAVENLSGDAVENRPNANITRSLQGQIPGLNIVQVDGKADHAGEVTIRGVNNTFKARVSGGEKTNKLGQGGGALVLIDGAEGDMGSVNPDDIASISVLKDASSAAVYGARGAFGVILITTKDPEKGKVRVSYNGSVSLHRRTVIWEDNVVTDPVQWVDAFRESYLNSSPTATVPSLFNNYMPYSNAWFEELKRRRADPTMDNYDIDANGNYNYYGETNWLKEIYKSVNYSTTHAVSIQGGREGVSYYISGRYYNQDGIYKVGEETYKKYNLRAKGSIRIRPWLTLDNNTSLMSSKYHQPMVHYGQQVISRQIDMFAFPFALLKNPDGTWTQTAAKTGYAAFAEGTSWQENNKLEVANTTTFNFEFVPDVFKVSADVTYKGSRWSRDRMENLYTYYTGVNVSGQDNSFSSLENWTYRSDYISTNIVGTVTPKLGADHDLNVVAGWNLEDYDYRTQKTYRQGNLYPSKPSFTLMDGEYYSTTSGGYTWGLVGFFGRVNYAYAGRYLAEVSARYDGSSKFPSSSQWGFFPSASVGWRLSEEPWLKPHVEGWLDNFKVRASIGSLGNANIDPYQYLETMTASGSASIAKSSVIINGQNVPYTSVPSLIPDDITWEKVTTYNIGLDLDLFHNRLSFTGDYYRRNTTDLYTVGPNLPQVLGSAAPYGNYASLKTKGWELSLSWRDSFNLGGKPFSYSIKGMLWDSRSWITDYYNETGDLTTYYKGMEIGEIWGFRTAGIYASNADALNGPAYNFFKNGEMFRAYAGDLRFVDVDGDGIMTKGNRTLSNHGDLEIIGNQSPRYQYSINMSLNWNGIGLSMLWQGVGKRDWYPWTESGFFWGKWNRAYNSLMKTQTGDNVVRIDKSTDNWRVTNMDKNPYWTRMVSLAANRNDGPLTWENDHYLQDASYIRLKNITIDYTFPKHICKKLRLEGLKVYLSGENLFTHSPMFKHTDMFDPEVITSGDSDFAASTTSGLNGVGLGLRIAAVGGRVVFQVGLEDRFQRDAVAHGIHDHRPGASQRERHQQGRAQRAGRVARQRFVRTVKASVDRSARRHAVGHHQLLERSAVLLGVIGRVAHRILRFVVTARLRAPDQTAAQLVGAHRRAAVPVQAGRHPRLGLSVTRDVFLGGVAGQFRFGHAVHGRDARELGLRVGCHHVVVVVERDRHAQGVHPRNAERELGRRGLGSRVGQYGEFAVGRQRIARIGVRRTRSREDHLAAAEIVVEAEHQVVLVHLCGIAEGRKVGYARPVNKQVGFVGQLPHLDLPCGEARILRPGAHGHRRLPHVGG